MVVGSQAHQTDRGDSPVSCGALKRERSPVLLWGPSDGPKSCPGPAASPAAHCGGASLTVGQQPFRLECPAAVSAAAAGP